MPIESYTLLKGSIVEGSAKIEPVVSPLKNLGIRLNAILKGLFHLPSTILSIAHFEERSKPHSSPALKCGAF